MLNKLRAKHNLRNLSKSLYLVFARLYVVRGDTVLYETILKQDFIPRLLLARGYMATYDLSIQDMEKTVFRYFLMDVPIYENAEQDTHTDPHEFLKVRKDFLNTIESIFNLHICYSAEKLFNVIDTLFKFYNGSKQC